MNYDNDSYANILQDIHPGKTIDLIVNDDSGACYEWDVVAVYKVVEDGIYYLVSDNGCSCDAFGQFASYDDLIQFSSRRSLLHYLRNSKVDKIKGIHSQILVSKA